MREWREEMYVTELQLREFRGIKECQEAIKFTKFNILLGRNSSGKSTVLQALSLLPHPQILQPMDIRIAGEAQRLTGLARGILGGDSSLIYRYAGKASLHFEVVGKTYSITLDRGGRSQAFADGGEKLAAPELACQYLDVDWDQASDWAVYVPHHSGFVALVVKKLSSDWDSIERADLHVRAVRDIINPTIDEVFTEVLRRDSSLWVRKETEGQKPYYVQLEDLGDGIQKALSMFLFVEMCSPKIVLWDDFEASAHPGLLKSLLSWLVSKDWQVVLATHSIDVLYELVEMEPENTQVLQLKKEGDVLGYKSLTIDQIADFLGAGNDPRLLVDAVA